MTDTEFSARLRTNLLAFKTLQAGHGPLRTLVLPGVRAFALPSRPDNLFQQQVLPESPEALAEAFAPLREWYLGQGVRAWRVSVQPWEVALEAVLARSDYHPEDSIPAMGLSLVDLPPRMPHVGLERPDDLDAVLELNALSYGREDVGFFEAWRSAPLPSPHVHPVLAGEGGRALSCGLTFEREGTAGIYLVATHPDARHRGLAAEVMHALHVDARARGCTVAVLQASLMGHGLYRRLGYRDVGAWTNWVHRAG